MHNISNYFLSDISDIIQTFQTPVPVHNGLYISAVGSLAKLVYIVFKSHSSDFVILVFIFQSIFLLYDFKLTWKNLADYLDYAIHFLYFLLKIVQQKRSIFCITSFFISSAQSFLVIYICANLKVSS